MADRLQIFLSSPGDVVPERMRAALVIARLAKDYARFFRLEPYLWEYEPMLASGHFQDVIEPPSEADVVLLILWSRLGTNLPQHTEKRDYKGIDGRVPVTGTEWEFEDALRANHAKGVPDLLVYRKTEDPQVSLRNQQEKAAREAQWSSLEIFWRRYFADKGEFKSAYSDFADLESFEHRLELDLRTLIERRIKTRSLKPSDGAVWLAGNPFRGLEAYAFEHAPVFFGRADEIKRGVEMLAATRASGRAFLLILGASGTGKSSLAQAGIVPALYETGVVAGVGLWRRAVMRPGNADGPFQSLAAALVTQGALPELLAPGQTVDDLARHLAASPQNPSYPIAAALAQLETTARTAKRILPHEVAHLVLVVDQLEELFTGAHISAVQRAAFMDCLDNLARSDRVSVIATMRSDHWHRTAEAPLLVEMCARDGKLDLLPARQVEIGEMIRRPAQAAGLSFERDPRSEIALDAILTEEASIDPGALPLLSFLLGQLYQIDVEEKGGHDLTLATTRALGGLKGAIAARAEVVLMAQPEDVRAQLPILFQLLIQSRLGEDPTARTALLKVAAPGTPLRRLIDAFLAADARLLVADGDTEEARIRLAHEALLAHWERAVDWLRQNHRDLETRARLEEAETLWSHAPSRRDKSMRLLTGLTLAEGQDLVARWGATLNPRVTAFVKRSQSASWTAWGMRAAGFAGLVLVILFAGGVLFLATLTEADRSHAQMAQSLFLTHESEGAAANGDFRMGTLLALNALPAELDSGDRPVLKEAIAALSRSFNQLRLRAILHREGQNVLAAAFGPGDKTVLTIHSDGTLATWDGRTGSPIRTIQLVGPITIARFSPTPGQVLIVRRYSITLVDTSTGHQVQSGWTVQEAPQQASFSLDGKTIALSSDHSVDLLDLRKNKLVSLAAANVSDADRAALAVEGVGDNSKMIEGQGSNNVVHGALARATTSDPRVQPCFSSDGSRLAVVLDRYAVLYDTARHNQTAVIGGDSQSIEALACAPRNGIVATSTGGRAVRLWDGATGRLLTTLLAQGNDSPGNADIGTSLRFAPDAMSLIYTRAGAPPAVFDIRRRAQVSILGDKQVSGLNAAYSPDGNWAVIDFTDNVLELTPAHSASLQPIPLVGLSSRTASSTFSRNNATLLTLTIDGKAEIWNVGKPAPLFADERAAHLAFRSQSGRYIAVQTGAHQYRFWDTTSPLAAATNLLVPERLVETGKPKASDTNVASSSSGEFSATAAVVAVSNDGPLAVATGGHIFVRYPSQWTELKLPQALGNARQLAYSVSGKWLAAGFQSGAVGIWEAGSATPVHLIKAGVDRDDQLVFVDSDRKLLVSTKGKFGIFDMATGKLDGMLRVADEVLTAPVAAKDGSHVASTVTDGSVRIWDTRSFDAVTLRGENGEDQYNALAFTPDGTKLLVETGDYHLRLYDVASGAADLMFEAADSQQDPFDRATYSADGNEVITRTLQGAISVWDAKLGIPLMQYKENEIYDAFFLNDGEHLIADNAKSGLVVLPAPRRCGALLEDARKTAEVGDLSATAAERVYFSMEDANGQKSSIYELAHRVLNWGGAHTACQ